MNSYDTEDVVDLSGFDEAFARSEGRRTDPNADVPDGEYDTIIESLQLTRTGSSNRPMIIFRLRITGPTMVGRALTKTWVITENTVGYIKDDFERCGVRLTKMSELKDHVRDFEERSVLVQKRTKADGSEIYFRWPKRANDAPLETSIVSDDDLPF